jgi:hypothetical protein
MSEQQLHAKVTKAVDALIADLSDRRGLGQEWDQIDEDLQVEIRAELLIHARKHQLIIKIMVDDRRRAE